MRPLAKLFWSKKGRRNMTMRTHSVLLAGAVLLAVSAPLAGLAQQKDSAAQIASAVLPLPEAMRAGATVVSLEKGIQTVLRKGTNGMVCTDYSTAQLFQANCFHETIFALLRRVDALSKDLKGKALDEAIDKEIQAGKLTAPPVPSMGFQMRGPVAGYDPVKHTVSKDVNVWQMVIIPHATGASLMLPEQPPGNNMPWVMNAGSWIAHIMVEH
jgi:hypothetical protein